MGTHARRRKHRTAGRAAAAGVLLALPAQAHMVSTGIGPFYDGLSHVFVTPLDLLFLLGSILVTGLAGMPRARVLLIVVLCAWIGGVPLGALLLAAPWSLDAVFSAALILFGAMAALDRRWPVSLLLALLFAANALLALNAGAGLLAEGAPLQLLLGLLTGVGGVLILGTALAVSRRTAWQRVALRAAGSWLAAIGLMSLAWTLYGPAR